MRSGWNGVPSLVRAPDHLRKAAKTGRERRQRPDRAPIASLSELADWSIGSPSASKSGPERDCELVVSPVERGME